MVLLSQDLVQWPEAHLLNVTQLPMSVEVVFGILASTNDALWHSAQQLYEQSQVILIPVCQTVTVNTPKSKCPLPHRCNCHCIVSGNCTTCCFET